jgi:uncharacterized membrane protein YkoI
MTMSIGGGTVWFVSLMLASSMQTSAPAKSARQIDLSKYPGPVRETIQRETQHATLKSVSKEREKGQTQYEVETLVQGQSRDLLVDPAGKILEIEEEVALETAPAAVRDSLNARGTVLKLERVQRQGAVSYEAQIKEKSGKKTSIALDGDGKPVKG